MRRKCPPPHHIQGEHLGRIHCVGTDDEQFLARGTTRDGRDMQPVRVARLQILAAMYGEVDGPAQQLVLDLLREEAFALQLVEGQVLHAVALRLDDPLLGAMTSRLQARFDMIGLP